MNKIVKRVIIITSLLLLCLVVGYLFFTGSRLSSTSDKEQMKNTFYCTNSRDIYLDIDKNANARYFYQGKIRLLSFESIEDGILTFKHNDNSFSFIILNDGILDAQTDTYLGRGDRNAIG